MKRILSVIIILVFFISCSVEDTLQEYTVEKMPIESVDLPQVFVYGNTYTVTITYEKPTSCHGYDGIIFSREENTRTIAIQNILVVGSNCQDLTNEFAETSFDITVEEYEPYVFKFWQGKNDDGEDIFLEYEIMVVTN